MWPVKHTSQAHQITEEKNISLTHYRRSLLSSYSPFSSSNPNPSPLSVSTPSSRSLFLSPICFWLWGCLQRWLTIATRRSRSSAPCRSSVPLSPSPACSSASGSAGGWGSACSSGGGRFARVHKSLHNNSLHNSLHNRTTVCMYQCPIPRWAGGVFAAVLTVSTTVYQRT